MKRIGIDALFLALQILFMFFLIESPHPHQPSNGEIAINFSAICFGAVLGFSLLLGFVKVRTPWLFLIDAVLLCILTVVADDIVSVMWDPYHDYYTIVPLSFVFSLPILLVINILSLTLVIFAKRKLRMFN